MTAQLFILSKSKLLINSFNNDTKCTLFTSWRRILLFSVEDLEMFENHRADSLVILTRINWLRAIGRLCWIWQYGQIVGKYGAFPKQLLRIRGNRVSKQSLPIYSWLYKRSLINYHYGLPREKIQKVFTFGWIVALNIWLPEWNATYLEAKEMRLPLHAAKYEAMQSTWVTEGKQQPYMHTNVSNLQLVSDCV